MRALIVASFLAAAAAWADKPVPSGSGEAMCVLTADDFKAAGVTGAGKVSANVSERGASAYCSYSKRSSGTGGIELDVFFKAGENATEAKATEDTAADESSGKVPLKPLKLSGCDSSRWSPSAAGEPEYALLVVRRDLLVFVLGIPKHKDAEAQLAKLGALVLARLGK